MDVGERILENGYEDVIYFTDYSYDDALIGISADNRAVYDYEKMVDWLVEKEGFESYDEAVEWIDYNVLGFYVENGPIVVYPLMF